MIDLVFVFIYSAIPCLLIREFNPFFILSHYYRKGLTIDISLIVFSLVVLFFLFPLLLSSFIFCLFALICFDSF